MQLIKWRGLVTLGLAIFSMFFGAGNLMYPLRVGLLSGEHTLAGFLGFCLTGVLLPLAGLCAIILFDGDYNRFFERLGRIPGAFLILVCMIVIGPLIAMPRIVTLSHTMIAPFMGEIGLSPFTFLFLLVTFLGTYKESRIINLLGNLVSPLLVVSLSIIVAKGCWSHTASAQSNLSGLQSFFQSAVIGYQTLDLIGAIFFSAIVVSLLKQSYQGVLSKSQLMLSSLISGAIGTGLLAAVYAGMAYLGRFYGMGLEYVNEGELFSQVSFRVLGHQGSIIIAVAVLMACYSTIVALAAVVAEYVQHKILRNRISFLQSLLLTLGATAITSHFGLTTILRIAGPLMDMFYPIIIVLTLCNAVYALFGFKAVKLPVAATALIVVASRLVSLL